jgi:DNA-binding NarL/FixJ family response regulator
VRPAPKQQRYRPLPLSIENSPDVLQYRRTITSYRVGFPPGREARLDAAVEKFLGWQYARGGPDLLRILVGDDDDLIRSGLRHLLEEHSGWEVCGEAVTCDEAVALTQQLVPDIAILDLEMPELDGLEATREIKRTVPSTELLILTTHDSKKLMRTILAAGARGYLLKSDALRHVVLAVETLAARKPFFSSAVSETLLEAFLEDAKGDALAGSLNSRERELETALEAFLKDAKSDAFAGPLTSREQEIVQLLAGGNSGRQIASHLGISIKTVQTHRTKIARKLGVKSKVDIVRYAMRNGLVMP